MFKITEIYPLWNLKLKAKNIAFTLNVNFLKHLQNRQMGRFDMFLNHVKKKSGVFIKKKKHEYHSNL